MKYPTLPTMNSSREMMDTFKGYNHNLLIGENEFFDMKNMTSDHYPLLAPRGKRGVYASPESAQGLISKDTLCYVDGEDFIMDGYPIAMGLSTAAEDCPKKLISVGKEINIQGYLAVVANEPEACIGCGACFHQCPEPGAITIYEIEE